MKVISPAFEILTPIDGIEILKTIETVGRTCYKSEDKITDDSCVNFVQGIINRGHEAVIEHYNVTTKIICDRGVSHELVRHRIASYAQESTRYVSYSNKPQKIETDEDVLAAYATGLSMKKISDRSNGTYTEWDIYRILEEHEIEKRNHGNRGFVYEDYFEVINTPEKAYLMGFIQADGSIRKELSQLIIAQKGDEQWWILNMIRDFIQPDAKSLTIHNKKICSDLFNKGIIPNKTYKDTKETMNKLWNSIPDELKPDFLRGLLDGDGNIRWFYQTEGSKTQSCNIGFTGNIFLMNIISQYLLDNFNYSVKVFDYDTYARITVTDAKVGKALCEKMYYHFKFPYGHSKTARYYEAFNLEIPHNSNSITTKDFNVIIPEYEICGGKNGLYGKQLWAWGNAMLDAELHYKNMIELGSTPQIARSVLPNSLKTEICITANLREWRNIFALRCSNAAHPQIRQIMLKLLKTYHTMIPIVFDDLYEKYCIKTEVIA